MGLNTESFDLHRFFQGLEEMFKFRAQQKGLSFKFSLIGEVPMFIRTDRNKLRQVLINLLGNAVKYTEQGYVALEVQCKEEQQGRCALLFSVEDTGIGIPEHEKNLIFDAFYQIRDRQSSFKGSGLGLPISNQFIDLMGGELQVESEVGQGSLFTFTLPVELAESKDIEPSLFDKRFIGLAPGQPEFRILVAEDNLENRILLVTLLRTVGFEVWEAVNGREAVELWLEWQPHLIFMDIQMPEMDGLQAIREIRALPDGKEAKIIALTAFAFEEDRKKVLETGGDDYVRKPFTEADIIHQLEKHLGALFEISEGDHLRNGKAATDLIDRDEVLTLLQDIPVEVLSRLKEEVIVGEVTRLKQVIEEVGSINPGLGKFLQTLADEFAYDEIGAYLDAEDTSSSKG